MNLRLRLFKLNLLVLRLANVVISKGIINEMIGGSYNDISYFIRINFCDCTMDPDWKDQYSIHAYSNVYLKYKIILSPWVRIAPPGFFLF